MLRLMLVYLHVWACVGLCWPSSGAAPRGGVVRRVAGAEVIRLPVCRTFGGKCGVSDSVPLGVLPCSSSGNLYACQTY
jgi:hypothetical protein